MAIITYAANTLATATAFVVASDAPAWERELAQFLKGRAGAFVQVCDGVGDEVEIRAAIDALTSGGKCHLSTGRFVIDGTTQTPNGGVITVQKDNVTIEGTGRSTVCDFMSGQLLNDRYMFSVLGAAYERQGVAFKNFTIKGHDPQHHGWRLAGFNDYLIENVWGEHDGSGGASTDEFIQHSGSIAAGRGGVIRNVVCTGWDIALEYADDITDCHNYDVHLFDCGRGINFRTGGSVVPTRIHTIDPFIRGCTVRAIGVDKGDLLYFIGGSIVSCGTGFHCTSASPTSMVLFGLVAEGCDGAGFFIQGDSHRVLYCTARNNGQDSALSAVARSGLRITATNCDIAFNEAYDNQGTKTQQRGITEGSNPAGNRYYFNNPHDNAAADWSLGANVGERRMNKNLVTENQGSSTQSGNGAATSFTIAHGLAAVPTSWAVTPASADARGSFHVTADGTNLTITYSAAPVNGVNNLTWKWRAWV